MQIKYIHLELNDLAKVMKVAIMAKNSVSWCCRGRGVTGQLSIV